jgi:hypothetical protein
MRRVPAVRLVAALAVALMAFAGCAHRTARGAAPAESAAPEPAASQGVASDDESNAPTVLEDGRHPVYLTALDTSARTVTFDLIEFLTGQAAKKAWLKDHPDEPDGPPNDYYIVNQNPKLRTLPIAMSVTVKVVDLSGSGAGSKTIAFSDLPSYLAGDPVPDDKRLWPSPFWLTVKSGLVTVFEEQFVP